MIDVPLSCKVERFFNSQHNMNIVEFHLRPGQFFPQRFPKRNIVLHHTVSSTATSPLAWWNFTPERIGTAYIIGKNGAIYEAFPPEMWAHHLGLRSSRNLDLNRRSIGIELVNEGPLLMPEVGEYRWNFSNANPNGTRYKGKVFTSKPWRGYQLWAEYTDEQYEALNWLLKDLLQRFKLPATMCTQDICSLSVADKYTIYSHAQVRADKSDLHPGFDWKKISLSDLQ